jgi:hypothetical protein
MGQAKGRGYRPHTNKMRLKDMTTTDLELYFSLSGHAGKV